MPNENMNSISGTKSVQQAEPISKNDSSILTLNQLKPGQMGLIISIKKDAQEWCQEIDRVGISPCALIRMIANHAHHLIFDVNYKVVAVDKASASRIAVYVISMDAWK